MLQFNTIKRDAFGRIETPVLMLLKPHGEVIGALGHYSGLNMELKYNESSEVSFQYPKMVDGEPTPFYDDIVGGTLVQIDPYGIFIINNPSEEGDGIKTIKSCTAYSLEYELNNKNVVFAEGTYNLETVLGMILHEFRNWGYNTIPASLIGRYRTFDGVESKALTFMMDTLQSTYNCVFVFDTYDRIVSVLDADDDLVMLPIYLSYQNLISEASVDEIDDEMFTKLDVHGADPVSIRNVNPTGTNVIYNLNYHIGKGHIPSAIADKWNAWQNAQMSQQQYYTSVVALRNAAMARRLTETARLRDMEGELASLDNIRSTSLQGQALAEPGSTTWQYFADRLVEIGNEYTAKTAEIEKQEALLEALQAEYDGYSATIIGINDELRMSSYFEPDELDILDHYIKEDAFTDDTFATFSVDVQGQNDSFIGPLGSEIGFTDISLTDVSSGSGHFLASIDGGKMHLLVTQIEGSIMAHVYEVEANIISGIIDINDDNRCVCSFYLGSGKIIRRNMDGSTINTSTFPSGNLTYTGNAGTDTAHYLLMFMTKTEEVITSPDGTVSYTIEHYSGNGEIFTGSTSIYLTRNVTDYQTYAVEQELYDYAVKCLDEIAYPTYEFDIRSGNIIFAKEFEPFKNALKLGCGVYLQVADDLEVKPLLLEIHIDFEEPDNFDLVFSNRFQRPDKVNGMKSIISQAKTTARSLDMKKYEFGAWSTSGSATWVEQVLKNGFDAALQQIKAGDDQCVTINEAGIKIAAVSGTEYILLNNGMIALVDDSKNEVKLALGHFLNSATGTDFTGILAEIIGGTLIAGRNLIIECPDINGDIMQFKVDSSGVFLYNSRMYLQSAAGRIGMDANHGLFAGTAALFDTTDTGYVRPTCIDEDGNMIFDDDGFPLNTNVWIGIDGRVYLRGNIYAENGYFNGVVNATSGTFKGVVQASDFLDSTGTSMMSNGKWDSSYLDLGNIQLDGDTGDITMTGNINLSGASSINWGSSSPVKYQFSVSGLDETWHDTMEANDKYRRDSLDGGANWGPAYQFRGTDGAPGYSVPVTFSSVLSALQSAANTQTTFITADNVGAPTIYGAKLYGAEIYAGGVGVEGGQVIGLTDSGIQIWNGSGTQVLRIYERDGGAYIRTGLNYLTIASPFINFREVSQMDFSGVANIIGLHATFA